MEEIGKVKSSWLSTKGLIWILICFAIIVPGVWEVHRLVAAELKATENQDIAILTGPLLVNGTYPISDSSIRPLPSVVFDQPAHAFQLQVVNKGQNATVEVPMDNVRIVETAETERVTVDSGKYIVYLHKNAQITEVTAINYAGSGQFTKGIVVGVLLHAILH